MKISAFFRCSLRRVFGAGLALVVAAVSPAIGFAQLAYTGGAYSQNFNSLPSSGAFTLSGNGPHGLSAAPINASDMSGWSLLKYAGTGSNALFQVNNGAGTSGAVFSYGTTDASDRALGSLASGSTISRFGVTLVNYTGQTVTQFTLSYTGEQWRTGGDSSPTSPANPNTLAFDYSIGAANIGDGSFTAVNALDFTSPIVAATAAALDGNLAANRVARTATISGISWEAGQTLVLRWTDINDTGNDQGLAVDDLTFSTDITSAIPGVVGVSPASGAVNVATTSPLSLTFNLDVNVTGSWFTLNGSSSGPISATVSGGPRVFTLMPAAPFAAGETVTLTVFAAQVSDAATGAVHPASDVAFSFITTYAGATPIHVIQGAGATSAYAGHAVSVQGIVTAVFQAPGQLGGFYVQTPESDEDGNPLTSEGLFVFENTNSVTVGDFVTVAGTVTEFGTAGATETQVSSVTNVTIGSSGNPLPAAAELTLPFASATYLERYEGMRVTLPQTLTVTNNYDYGRYGELVLSNGRLNVPTNVVAPGAAAVAYSAQNKLNQIKINDGRTGSNPDPTPWLPSGDPSAITLRTGSTATGVTGVFGQKFGSYVIDPTVAPTFVDANPRSASPANLGTLRIAAGNVENLMNGDGLGGGFPTSRGPSNLAEYERQIATVTAGILAIAPDIMGLTEVENDRITNGEGTKYGPTSMIAQLVASLNAHAPAGTTYAFVNASAVDIVTDVIHSAFIYRVETVETVGAPAMLSSDYFNSLARNPLAQTFREKATGEVLTICINHFRAKASVATTTAATDGGLGNNADSGDGQGTNNYLRVRQAQVLTAWLATDPTGSGDPDFLIVGDLNAYAKEDPIQWIVNAGYVNLTERFEGEGGYSYQFGGEFGHLDHALATPSLNAQVVSTATWHANSDEPVFYDYNLENKSPTQQAINVGTGFRFADHDPVIVGLALATPRIIARQPLSQSVELGSPLYLSVGATGTGQLSYQWFKDDVAIDGANSASYEVEAASFADAGDYAVIVSDFYGSTMSNTVTVTVNSHSGSPRAEWRFVYFGTADNAGPAADDADPDGDGLVNLVEYALGLDPTVAGGTGLPEPGHDGANWTYTYARPANRADVTYAVEVSTDLVTWTTDGVSHVLVSQGDGVSTYQATYPAASAPVVFFRLRIADSVVQ